MRNVDVPSAVCVDINVALKLLLPEHDSDAARTVWQSWIDAGAAIVAPPVFLFEGTSVLSSQVHRGRITPDEGRAMLAVLGGLGVRLVWRPELHVRALDLAIHHGQPQAYDAHYLALAESVNATFWTADRRLVAGLRPRPPWVALLDEVGVPLVGADTP